MTPSRYRDCFPDWEIRKAANGHKSAARTDSPDGGAGKTCLGGGMHCLCTVPVLLVSRRIRFAL